MTLREWCVYAEARKLLPATALEWFETNMLAAEHRALERGVSMDLVTNDAITADDWMLAYRVCVRSMRQFTDRDWQPGGRT